MFGKHTITIHTVKAKRKHTRGYPHMEMLDNLLRDA